MHLTVIATVFPLVFVAELPDKTMFASLLMATKGRPAQVWLGAAGAFVVHVAIATTVGVAKKAAAFFRNSFSIRSRATSSSSSFTRARSTGDNG